MNVLEHLRERHVQPERYDLVVDDECQIATFKLYNAAGFLAGYQRYRPFAPKTGRNDPQEGRYYTRVAEGQVAFFGAETLYYTPHFLVVTEGLFDCVRFHNKEVSAIAVLANDPKHMLSLFQVIKATRFVLAVCDNDSAGRKLAKVGHAFCTTTTKDCGDMTDDEFEEFFYANVSSFA